MQKRYWIYSILLLIIGFFIVQFSYSYKLYTSVQTNEKTIGYEQYEDIPQNIIDTIIKTEDKRFWKHPGVDPIALGRSLYQTVFKNNTQGGSTIDQQVIKLVDEQFNRSITRKIYEIRSALNLQFHYSKKEILTTYVNIIPFSNGIKGWNAACNIYFHKGCEYATNEEIGYLLAVGQLGVNPYNQKNQKTIIQRAKILGYNVKDNIVLYPYNNNIDPKIELFLNDLEAQGKPQNSFSQETYDKIEHILATTQAQRTQYNANYCCVTLVNSKGDIISMNTCSDRNDDKGGKTNECIQPRQVGSAIKPFLYTYAFKKLGRNANTHIIDEEVSFDLGNGDIYSPKNFDLQTYGDVTIAFALGNSLNIPAIKTLHEVGVSNFLGFLKTQLATYASGYDHNTKNADNVGLSLALGTYEISPYAFTQLWRFFLPDTNSAGYTTQAKEIIDILSNPNNRVNSFGQDSFLNVPGWAVKTGTSRKFIDGRVCGVQTVKGLALCVWMGNIDNQAMKGPSSEVGSYIWSIIAESS